jgi:tRNA(fMet)-specific endonuclease VapC
MRQFLLDTNIVSDLISNPAGRVYRRLATLAPETFCTSIVVAAEMRFGAAIRRSPRLSRYVEEILLRLPVKSFESPADLRYAEIRATLESRGEPLGANDTFIAAHALALDCVLVTGDRAFERVPGLAVENWFS